MAPQRPIALALVALVGLLASLGHPLPAAAAAQDDDVRLEGACTGRSEAALRLRADDGEIRIEFELETERRRSRWAVVLLHERRIVFHGQLRARSDRLRLRRTVRDYFGSDSVVVRAIGPKAETCRVAATLGGEGSARRR